MSFTTSADPVPHRARSGRVRGLPVAPVTSLLGLLVGAAAALPLGYLVWRASEIGWARSWEIATSPRSLTLLGNTVRLAIAVTVASIIISVPLAWLTSRTNLPGRRFWVIVTALPLAVPTYVGSFAVIGALGPRGVLQSWLEPLGVERIPSIYGFWGAFAVLTFFSYPYVLLTVRAAYRRLDPSLEEASRTLGHGSFTTFRRIVLPQLRPSIAAGGLLVSLYTLSDFGAVAMLRYDTFTRAIYTQYRGALDRSTAAVLGLMLVVLTIAVLVVEQRFRGREQLHRLHGSGARTPRTADLGRWRWPAFAACGTFMVFSLAVPMAVVGWWWWRGINTGLSWFPDGSLVWNSIRAAALGAITAVAAAWPVAWLSARHRGPLSRLIERLAWSGYALPGLVVALALVFFGIRVAPFAYQTLTMLVFAYVVLFLPQAIGALRTSFLQITPSVEEASRLLGAGSLRTFWRVVLPLARPGALAGGALVFLTAMKELPATLLLAPTGYGTLSTRVWNATSEGFLARAAAPALALVLLSSLPMALIVLREHERRDHTDIAAGSAVGSVVAEGDGGHVDGAQRHPIAPSEG